MSEVATGDLGNLLVAGLTHHTASGALRDRLFLEEPRLPDVLKELRALGLEEVMLLATCDRLEVVARTADPGLDEKAMALLAERLGVPAEEILAASRTLTGDAALRHLFAVAASLDSQVVGEPQVLGQVKAAHRVALGAGTLGALLDRCLQAAYGAAKRVRSETAIGEESVSLAATALRTAQAIHGDLSRVSVLLIGLGEMGELLASAFHDAGVSHLEVLHRAKGRAAEAAERLGGRVRAPEELAEALPKADVVISAWGTGRYSLAEKDVFAALRERRRRPMLLLDMAVPSDIEPSAEQLEDAFLYSLDDLERLALAGKRKREEIAAEAWALLDEELAATQRAFAEREAVPALRALREHGELLRREVLAGGKLDAEEATRLLLGRLLHEPSEALRAAAADGEELEKAVRRLFGLPAGDEEKTE